MGMSDIGPKMAQVIAQNAQSVTTFAKQVWATQWASAASSARNEKEQAEYAKIAEGGMEYELTSEGSSVRFQSKPNDISPYLDAIEHGTSPVAGGSGGTATNPDGSTYQSKVPEQFWGTPLPWLAKSPEPVSEGVQTILESLVPGQIQDAVGDSKDAIAPIVKEELAAEIGSMLGG